MSRSARTIFSEKRSSTTPTTVATAKKSMKNPMSRAMVSASMLTLFPGVLHQGKSSALASPQRISTPCALRLRNVKALTQVQAPAQDLHGVGEHRSGHHDRDQRESELQEYRHEQPLSYGEPSEYKRRTGARRR